MFTNSQVRIVVVDDTPPVSSYYKDILEDEGFSDVSNFLDPKEVLSLAKSGDLRPDIVVTDFDLGYTNGVLLLNSLLKINPFLKSIIVTGSRERVESVSRMYPIIEKNHRVSSEIVNMVKMYVEEFEDLKIHGF
jgi:DNA-binding NtrC family response regulator